MHYVVIEPARQSVEVIDTDDYTSAVQKAGLNVGEVDHGTVGPGVAIVVYEYSLFVPAAEQRWFSVGGQLFGGKALLYGFDEHGETVDLPIPPPVLFFANVRAAEMAIEAGAVLRPRTLGWEWPEPDPRPQR